MALLAGFVPGGVGGASSLLAGRTEVACRRARHASPRQGSRPASWIMRAAPDRRPPQPLIRSVKIGLVGLAALVGAVLAGPHRVRAAASADLQQQESAVMAAKGRRGRRARSGGILAAATPSSSTTAAPRKISTEKELSDNERLVSMGMTAAATGGLFFWAFRRNRKDDVDEAERIKNEVDRLEKWKKEFLDVEEGDESIPDEEMMGELRKRMGLPEPEEDETSDKEDTKDDSSVPTTAAAVDSPATPSDATSEAPDTTKAGQTDDEQDPDVSQEKLDMLRRMFEGSNEKDDKDSRDDRQAGSSGPSSAVLERPDGGDAPNPESTDEEQPPSPPSEQVDFLKRMWDADSKKDE